MHQAAYIFLSIIMILISLLYISKENLWFIKLCTTKYKNFNNLIISNLFKCLLYASIAYIYIIEGYYKKITYIFDDTENTEEDKQKKHRLKYNLIIIYIIIILIIFLVLKKIMDKKLWILNIS